MSSILSNLFSKFRQYTIGDLMNIDQGRQQKAAQCMVKHVNTYHELKKETVVDKFRNLFLDSDKLINSYYLILKFKVMSDSGGSHTVFLRVSPDFNLQDWQNNKIRVYCSCPDFKYRSAYLLKKNSSIFVNDRLKIQLGAALHDEPKSKSKTTLLCKHSFAAVNWLIQNYSGIMRSI